MCCCCCCQVRGALSPPDELAYIASNSRSSGLIVQDQDTLHKVVAAMKQVRGERGVGLSPNLAEQRILLKALALINLLN